MNAPGPCPRRLLCVALAAALLVVVLPGRAAAIPAFARKYQTSCQTCHIVFPKLNAFGEAFRLRGYHMPAETEEMVKQKPVGLDLGTTNSAVAWVDHAGRTAMVPNPTRSPQLRTVQIPGGASNANSAASSAAAPGGKRQVETRTCRGALTGCDLPARAASAASWAATASGTASA